MPLPPFRNAKLFLVLLHEIDELGGAAPPSAVYGKLRSSFPEITDADLRLTHKSGENVWTNRIRWARQDLVLRGCLDGTQRNVWSITKTGRDWLARHWAGATANHDAIPLPPLLSSTASTRKPADSSGGAALRERSAAYASPAAPAAGEASRPARAGQITTVTDPIDQLCSTIGRTGRLSNSPQQFEKALADAFTQLGFDTKHLGGPGATDIFVSASLGQSSYTAVVDAKSTHSGRVSDRQINWSVIAAHRSARSATFAAVVGEAFSGGQLQTFAAQYSVTLITTAMICELLRTHARTPFNLVELRHLFASPGLATMSIQALRERNQEHERHWRLIDEIVDTIAKFERQMPAGFAPKIDQLHLVLTTQVLSGGHSPAHVPIQQDVADAVGFLASRAVNVLVEVPGSNGAYLLAMSPAVARRRLRALARFVDTRTEDLTRPRSVNDSGSGQPVL